MEDSLNYAEYVVEKKLEGSYLMQRILMIVAYVALVVAFFVIGGTLIEGIVLWGGIFAVIMCIVVFFTWKLVSIENKYTIANGGTFTAIEVRGGKERELVSVKVSAMQKIAPANRTYESEYANVGVRYDICRSAKSDKRYFATFEKDGKKVVVFFDYTEQALRVMKIYNKNNIVMPA